MYMGHLGLALGAKGWRPSVPLWVLFCAALAQDLLDVVTGFAGTDGDLAYFLSHSPLMAFPLAALAGGAYWAVRDRGGAVVVAGLVLSHSAMDLLTSRLPIWSGGPQIGLHLYRYDPVDFSLETALVAGGWILYRRTLPETRRGSWPAWLILATLAAFQFAFQLLPIT